MKLSHSLALAVLSFVVFQVSGFSAHYSENNFLVEAGLISEPHIPAELSPSPLLCMWAEFTSAEFAQDALKCAD